MLSLFEYLFLWLDNSVLKRHMGGLSLLLFFISVSYNVGIVLFYCKYTRFSLGTDGVGGKARACEAKCGT